MSDVKKISEEEIVRLLDDKDFDEFADERMDAIAGGMDLEDFGDLGVGDIEIPEIMTGGLQVSTLRPIPSGPAASASSGTGKNVKSKKVCRHPRKYDTCLKTQSPTSCQRIWC